jgi:hypothetical protein
MSTRKQTAVAIDEICLALLIARSVDRGDSPPLLRCQVGAIEVEGQAGAK